jgi:hypothetical protein
MTAKSLDGTLGIRVVRDFKRITIFQDFSVAVGTKERKLRIILGKNFQRHTLERPRGIKVLNTNRKIKRIFFP